MERTPRLAGESGAAPAPAGRKTRKRGSGAGYAAQADRYLRQAQRAIAENGQPTPQADFFVRAANVYATLELARVFRTAQQDVAAEADQTD